MRKRLAEFTLRVAVAGPRGEVSADFLRLLDEAAEIGALRLHDQLPVDSPQTASAIMRWHARMRIGIACQRAGARHLLARLNTVCRRGVDEDAAAATAARASFGPDGPDGACDAYRTMHYADFAAGAWREVPTSA